MNREDVAIDVTIQDKHPEQAGGDERAAFEQWLEQHMSHHFSPEFDLAKYEDSGEYRYNPAADYWKAWQARAALAQPSQSQYEASFEEWLANELEGEDGQPVPAAVCDIALARRAFNHWPKLEHPAKVGGVRFSAGVSSRLVVEAAQRLYEFESTPEKEAERIERLQAFREQCFEPLGTEFSKVLSENLVELSSDAKPEQAEAERPEVVAYLFVKPDGTLSMDAVRHKPSQPAVAVMTVAQHERIVGELRADRDSWAEQAEQRLADWDEMRKERDAALARVEQQERTIASMNEAHAKLAGLYEAAQAQHSVPEGLALIPVRETEAMHDAVMALLYKGVARTDTQKLLDAYIAAAPGKEGV